MPARCLTLPAKSTLVTLAAATVGLSLASATLVLPAQAAANAGVYRMSVAGKPVTDASGATWQARHGFDKGDHSRSYWDNRDIKGTNDDALYRDEFVRMNSWSAPVAKGTYKVTLKMREAWWSAPGQRVFDVAAEGRKVLTDVDIIKAVGKHTAYDRTFTTTVADKRLDLAFTAKKDAALVSAILVRRIDAPSVPAPTTPRPTTPATGTPPSTPKPANPAPGRVSGLIFDSGLFSMHRGSEVSKFESARGAKADVIGMHPSRDSWATLHHTWWMDGERIPAGFRGTLDVAMPLWPNNGNIRTAAAGGYNGEWERFARTLAARYPTAYVRPGWEMNLPGWKHAAYPHQSEQWKQAFRHAYTSMKKVAPGLRIAWVVNEGRGQTGTEDAAMFYPGDAHVDLIGMDAYDWWPGYTNEANIARHRDGAYGWNHWLGFAKARGKKFVLPEWGVAPGNGASGGDNPMFINFVYSWLRQNRDHIAFEAYFHEADSYLRSDLFTGTNPRASAEYRRWMTLLQAK